MFPCVSQEGITPYFSSPGVVTGGKAGDSQTTGNDANAFFSAPGIDR